MREFDTGANRNPDDGKLDYEAFFSFPVIERFAQYMHKHRHLEDGTLRDGDNWQKGIPIPSYRKSIMRHTVQAWGVWRGYDVRDEKGGKVELEEAICGIIFNAMGMLHEVLKLKDGTTNTTNDKTTRTK